MRPRRFTPVRSLGICAAIAVGASLGVLAPTAMAAPANDAFANRTDLATQLPVRETESNVGATRESGEPSLGLIGGAGHSLWWAWEAPATEFVTVSTCQSPFPTVVGIFEGTELGHLTRVAEGNVDEGPSCLFQSGKTYTFKAQAGHPYAIGADGNAFYVPGPPGTPQPPPPTVEGEISLTLEATPTPPNDDFADATPIEETPLEEPGGGRRFMTLTDGYNWNATKEPGEPDHAGDPGGASVWYSWTAPESGEATIGYGDGGPGLLAVYTGSALDELTPVASTADQLAGVHIPVVGGTRYMIAVDGERSETTGEPQLGSFALTVFEQLKPGPGYSVGGAQSPCASCGAAAQSSPPPAALPLVSKKAKLAARRAQKIKARKARRARARARHRKLHHRHHHA
ncbi:MAG TPA: hypothetical protein VHZ54_04530 [Solirubrobacterales bacterium]|jgi:hypothetical protein|nr:hypothetical protein [Solirubrobacterales bacterium]